MIIMMKMVSTTILVPALMGIFGVSTASRAAAAVAEASSPIDDKFLTALQRPARLSSLLRPPTYYHDNYSYGMEKENDEYALSDSQARNLKGPNNNNNKQTKEQETCKVLMDSYLGTDNVERAACTACYVDPTDPSQYILFIDFTNYCSFCSSDDDDLCYTLTRTYTVKPWRGDPRYPEPIAYSACGTYHRDGRVACLDETYADWGEILWSKCVSVDGVSCKVCAYDKKCGGWWYGCENIEPDFWMDDCDYSINDSISNESVFVGFNYAIYNDDTEACFNDKNGVLGNIPAPTATPTESNRPSMSSVPSLSPSMSAAPTTTAWPSGSLIPSLYPSQGDLFDRLKDQLQGAGAPSSSFMPSELLSEIPSELPSEIPSELPSMLPSQGPEPSGSSEVSSLSTSSPSSRPSERPSSMAPTDLPMEAPSPASTRPFMSSVPSLSPSMSAAPTTTAWPSGSLIPSPYPSQADLFEHLKDPLQGTGAPSSSFMPSELLSEIPSELPSEIPSELPSMLPSQGPEPSGSSKVSSLSTSSPSSPPSEGPSSMAPTNSPTEAPSPAPTNPVAIMLDEFSVKITFPPGSKVVDKDAEVQESLAMFLYDDFRIDYENLSEIDLRQVKKSEDDADKKEMDIFLSGDDTNRKQSTEAVVHSQTFYFRGEARFFRQAPEELEVRAHEVASLFKLHKHSFHKWIVESVAVGATQLRDENDDDNYNGDDHDEHLPHTASSSSSSSSPATSSQQTKCYLVLATSMALTLLSL